MAKPTGRPIRDELVSCATTLIQRVGVNGFSYGDLATEVGITAPSIHHHFTTKADLVTAVVEDYASRFDTAVAAIPEGVPAERLRAYAELFVRTAAAGELCLCGSVLTDWLAIAQAPRTAVEGFFSTQRAWLTSEIARGIADGSLRSDVEACALSALVLATLEGASLMERSTAGDGLTNEVAAVILTLISA